MKCVAGGAGGESLQQPRFTEHGQLICLSDRLGYWQPWAEVDGAWALHPLIAAESEATRNFDCAPAPWQLGTSSYVPLADGGCC